MDAAQSSQEGKLHPCWPQESSVALRLRPANFTRFLPSQMFFRALSIATTDGQKRRSRLKPTALLRVFDAVWNELTRWDES
jgi:hypothetical protein